MSDRVGRKSRSGSRRPPVVRLGETTVTEWMPAIAERSPLGEDRVHLNLVTDGAMSHGTVVDIRGRLGDGWAFFTRGTRLGMQGSEDCRLTTVSVPLEVFPGEFGTQLSGVQIVKADSGLLAPVRAFISQVRATDVAELTGVGRYYLERLLQEMVLALSIDVDRVGGVPRAPDVFTRALAIIAAQCGDPELSSRSIARDVNLSLRQLERVFRDRSTTIGGEVRRARVEHAVALLRNREYDALSVDQVAGYSGFSNGSSLARAMRAAGYPSPSSLRCEL